MNERRKLLKAQYKERKQVGGVWRVLNIENGRFYLDKTLDIQGSHNWFLNCCTTGICTHPHLAKEWASCGKDAYVFEVLETWEKDEKQSDLEFKNDIGDLYEIWDEKLPRENRY